MDRVRRRALIVTARAAVSRRDVARPPAAPRTWRRTSSALGVDKCGERGEYHTVVTSTPSFPRPLTLRRGDASSARAAGRSTWFLRQPCSADERSSMLHAVDLSFAYPTARRVLDGVSLSVGARRHRRPARTERLRQDDADAAAGGTLAQRAAGHARRRAGSPLSAPRSRAPNRRGPAGDARSRSISRALEIVMMGRYPHLGAFEIEGPDDLAIARRGARRHGHGRVRIAARSPPSAAAKNSASSSPARCAQASDTPAPRRADGVARSRLPVRNRRRCSQRLNRERGTTMVVSTHDLNLAATLCTELVLLDGRSRPGARARPRGPDAVDRAHAVRRGRRRHLSPARWSSHGGADCTDRLTSARRFAVTLVRLRRADGRGRACSRRSSAARRFICRRSSTASIPFADNVDAQVFFVARLPRILAAAIVGGGLALSGVVFQALLRNPLASPDTLGVSAGATLGAMLAITFHVDFTLLGVSIVPLSSFAGALGALAIVYVLSTARQPRHVEHGAAAGRHRD